MTFFVPRTAVLIACAVVCGPCISLLAQSLDLAQYAHTAWRVLDGAPGGVRGMAQGADGVLWIASELGLFRFDGARFERFEPPPGQALPPYGAQFVLALPDTSLWIGHFTSGVSVLHRGRIATYGSQDGLPGGTVTSIARDSGGTMWAATTRGLARLAGRRWERIDSTAGFPGGFTDPVFVDGSGSILAVTGSTIYILRRGMARFERHKVSGVGGPAATPGMLVSAPDGSAWNVHPSFGLFPVADSHGGPPQPGMTAYADTGMYALAWQRDHPAVALGTPGRLLRLQVPVSGDTRPRAFSIPFSRPAGMSGALVTAALYDREGSLWIGTPTGVDRFRETKLTPITLPGYLDAPAVASDSNGRVWVVARHGTPAALLKIEGGIVPRLDAPSMITCIYRDLRGGLWIGGAGLWERNGDRFVSVRMPAPAPGGSPHGREMQAIARGRDGELWVSIAPDGVFRRRPGRDWEPFGAREGLARRPANVVTADSAGRTWLGYPGGQLLLVVGDSVRVFTPEQLSVGRILAISVYGNRVWISGQLGVAALDAPPATWNGGPHFVRLNPAREPLRGVSGIVELAGGELWLNGADGVTRIPAEEVRRALAEPGYAVQYERLDYLDGLEPPAQQIRPLPSAAAATDGRIWFASEGGVAWVDPRRVRRNPLPPPVHLLVLTAGGRRYVVENQAGDTLRLPPRTSALSVAYTAYSLAVPGRVKFKYRLEGLDPAWQDAGGRREAFFTNLPPGRYRFHVIASNDDGVWNTTGASLPFTIEPAWNQTVWFSGLLVLALVAGPAVAAVAWQRRRARLAADRTKARFDAILAERTRMARELHDTLLGGMAGVAMQLDAGARRVAAGNQSTETVAALLSTLDSQVRDALADTRRVVVAMRTPPQGHLLHEQLSSAAERTFAETEVIVHLKQTGTPRPCPEMVEAEVVGIAAEAMANARHHSGCRTVWIDCDYPRRELRVVVRDDGRGFAPSQATPAGHWGLIGMRERAASIGARLTITSDLGAGTEVVLVLAEPSGWSRLWSRLRR